MTRDSPRDLSETPASHERTGSSADGVPRRRLLRSSTAAAATGAGATLAGCLGGDDGGERAPTIYAFNTGDRTLSVIDAEADELIDTVHVDTTASFPANQYGTDADAEYETLWLNVSGGVRALDQETLEEVAAVETGFGPNYPNLTPDGEHLIVAAGGTTSLDPDPDEPENHVIVRIDADRDSETFGDVTSELEVGYVGPCDVTLDDSGEYAFVADINDETLRVVRVDPFETAARIDVGEPAYDEGRVLPFMCTASFSGEYLLVENAEGELGSGGTRRGSESIWDVSDPTEPEELARIDRGDGLPTMPITSEVSPDDEAAYLFTPGDGVTVVDVGERAIADVLDVAGDAADGRGSSLSGAWGPHREKLYVPVQDADHVAVIDHERREVATTIDVGEAPTGAVGGMVRPTEDALGSLAGSLASLGVEFGDREPTYCFDDHCYCG